MNNEQRSRLHALCGAMPNRTLISASVAPAGSTIASYTRADVRSVGDALRASPAKHATRSLTTMGIGMV
jgi:hypothetical protein